MQGRLHEHRSHPARDCHPLGTNIRVRRRSGQSDSRQWRGQQKTQRLIIINSVADPDPGSGASLTPGSGRVKNQDLGSGWTSRILLPDPEHCIFVLLPINLDSNLPNLSSAKFCSSVRQNLTERRIVKFNFHKTLVFDTDGIKIQQKKPGFESETLF